MSGLGSVLFCSVLFCVCDGHLGCWEGSSGRVRSSTPAEASESEASEKSLLKCCVCARSSELRDPFSQVVFAGRFPNQPVCAGRWSGWSPVPHTVHSLCTGTRDETDPRLTIHENKTSSSTSLTTRPSAPRSRREQSGHPTGPYRKIPLPLPMRDLCPPLFPCQRVLR